jgi:hypothetical protein
MQCVTTGFLLVAMLAGTGQQAPTPVPTTVPESVSASPALTEDATGDWSATLYLNTTALCADGTGASFALVTTGPDKQVRPARPPAYDPPFNCQALSATARRTQAASNPLTRVTLRFNGASGMPATPPAAAAVVVTTPQAAPAQVPVTVHRWVTGAEYLGVPALCGLGLWLLFITSMLLVGLRVPGGGTLRGRKILGRPLYAQSTWTFSGSWATNLTAAGAVTAAMLTATGIASEVLPGVEPGRFSLLIVAAGAITATAPLLFGALNDTSRRAVLPRRREVIASRVWPLLAASLLTLFGTGAELGILGVLACWLSSAGPVVRWASGALIVMTALVALSYSVVSIRALAEPAPGDALNAAGGSFIL